jgi:hypothetical protein
VTDSVSDAPELPCDPFIFISGGHAIQFLELYCRQFRLSQKPGYQSIRRWY